MRHYMKVEGALDRLREAIAASGLCPTEIMRRAGIPSSTFYEHLNGAALSELYVAKYCTVLGISADWLLGLKKGVDKDCLN